MKIEFRKIPLTASEYEINSDSVKFTGTFSKISTNLAKIDGIINGNIVVDCYRCGKEMLIELDEKSKFLVSDGIYKENEEDDLIVIEVEDHIVDFDELLQSEIESLRSEYYTCETCQNEDYLEVEY